MGNRVFVVVGLILLVLVLIGVTIIESVAKNYSWIQPLVPMIVIIGFFVFLVAVVLFLYWVIGRMKK